MKPIEFKEANLTLTKPAGMTDKECGSLKVFTDGEYCTSCWRPSFRERISILLFGRVWLSIRGGKTQPPVQLWAVRDPFVYGEQE